MITLYQLHWSHYVEKVRWALDYKGVEWCAVDVDPFTKREMQHLKCKTTLDSGARLFTVPTITDQATGAVVGESTEILEYLERTYPSPALYPSSAPEREAVSRWIVWLDSVLGLAARRLAYTQIALECPGLLAELFLPKLIAAGEGQKLKARLAGSIIAGVLAQRFRFLHNRDDRIFEQVEHCLLSAAARLDDHRYLVGDQFTAADLTLAALLRPVLLVPFIQRHSRLQRLFEWRTALLREHHRELQVRYEAVIDEVRRRRGWALGEAPWLTTSKQGEESVLADAPIAAPAVRNDQQRVSRWPVLTGPVWYWRLASTCGLGRTSYP
ncbi:MAG: glutathione S-transferase family protein [Gammaproteobacteria bacterium]